MSTGPTHYVLLLHAFAFAPLHQVLADSHRDDGDDVIFERDGAVVYRIARRFVAEIVACESQKAAADRAREHRESLAGARATRGIAEGGAAPRRKRDPDAVSGALTEGISVRIEER